VKPLRKIEYLQKSINVFLIPSSKFFSVNILSSSLHTITPASFSSIKLSCFRTDLHLVQRLLKEMQSPVFFVLVANSLKTDVQNFL